MKIAITTPTGNVGKAVVEQLQARGDHELVLLARHPDRLAVSSRRGIRVLQGSLDDPAFVAQATREVDALFWVTPSNHRSDDLRAEQGRLGEVAAGAVRANRIPRTVNLSSYGAHLSSGTGPIAGLHDVEETLDLAKTNVTHLRPGYFFENYLQQLESIRAAGCMFLPVSGQGSTPMIATADVAHAAVECLLDPDWRGSTVRELHGPADLTFDEAAAAISEGLDRRVVHMKVDVGQARDGMVAAGLSDSVSDLMLEMYQILDRGDLVGEQPRSAESTTGTTLSRFSRQVLAPLLPQES